MKRNLLTVLGLLSFLWVVWAFVLPVIDVAAHPIRDRKVDADVTMLGEFRGGGLSVRDYFWVIFKDGYEREIGCVSYGFGRTMGIEVAREVGGEPRVIHVFFYDGEVHYSKFFSEKDTPLPGWIISEGQKSLEMGRKRLKEYRDKNK